MIVELDTKFSTVYKKEVIRMTYQEKLAITNLLTSIVLSVVYGLIMYNRYQAGLLPDESIFRLWATIIVIFIPISIVARIIIMIIFHIINAIATEIKNEITGSDDEHAEDVRDERDKLIDLKANSISLYVMSAGLLVAFVTQMFDVSPHWFFFVLLISGVVGDALSEGKKFCYYRRGV